MRLALPLLTLLLLVGCQSDSRSRRASSAANTATKVAQSEFKAAPTPELKSKIAEDYFDHVAPIIESLDDYTHGRKPAVAPPLAPPVK